MSKAINRGLFMVNILCASLMFYRYISTSELLFLLVSLFNAFTSGVVWKWSEGEE